MSKDEFYKLRLHIVFVCTQDVMRVLHVQKINFRRRMFLGRGVSFVSQVCGAPVIETTVQFYMSASECMGAYRF